MNRIKVWIGCVLLTFFVMGASWADSIPGEYIVKLRGTDNPSAEDFKSSFKSYSFIEVHRLRSASPLYRVQLSVDIYGLRVLEAMKEDSRFEYIEPNFIYTSHEVSNLSMSNRERIALNLDFDTSTAPTDKLFKKQWSLSNTGQKVGSEIPVIGMPGADIQILPLWNAYPELKHAAKSVRVAIIDSGLDWKHADHKSNVWINLGEEGPWFPKNEDEKANALRNCMNLNCNRIDDDKNGYVDDVRGWNWSRVTLLGGMKEGNSDINDGLGHGTHVAGIIGLNSTSKIPTTIRFN